MAKGQRKTLDQKLEAIDIKISDLKSKVKTMEEEKHKLIKADKAEKIEKIIQYAEQKSISIDEILKKISD